jgi:hypothetical protein
MRTQLINCILSIENYSHFYVCLKLKYFRIVDQNIALEIKTLMKVRQTCIAHIKRCQNNSSHFLANYVRTNAHTALLFASVQRV